MKNLNLTLDPYEALDLALALETRLDDLRARIAAAVPGSTTEHDREGLRLELEGAQAIYVRLLDETRQQTGTRL